MYYFNSRVRYSEVNSSKKLDLASIINYFQDCSTFQSEDMEVGLEYLANKKRVWILNSWQIIVDRFPYLGEDITTATWAYDFKSMYGYRNFIIKDSSNSLCARANSIWVYMDTETNKPVKVLKEDICAYGLEDKLTMDYAPRKIQLPTNFVIHDSFPVISANIDTNNHVNNGQYIKMAEEYLPADFSIQQLRAEYKMSAVFGDIIVPKIHISNNLCTVVLSNTQNNPFAIIEFSKNM
jgi:medium-chain acyl-[acyl-carrier-protein] hydrolase